MKCEAKTDMSVTAVTQVHHDVPCKYFTHGTAVVGPQGPRPPGAVTHPGPRTFHSTSVSCGAFVRQAAGAEWRHTAILGPCR
jgi:hypothetical protein